MHICVTLCANCTHTLRQCGVRHSRRTIDANSYTRRDRVDRVWKKKPNNNNDMCTSEWVLNMDDSGHYFLHLFLSPFLHLHFAIRTCNCNAMHAISQCLCSLHLWVGREKRREKKRITGSVCLFIAESPFMGIITLLYLWMPSRAGC